MIRRVGGMIGIQGREMKRNEWKILIGRVDRMIESTRKRNGEKRM